MDISTPLTTGKNPNIDALTVQKKSAALSSDFDTFLKMLTVQMQNQDPLNPVDSSDYAVQLATFSNVEQQVKTNELLSSLSTHLGSDSLSQLSNWVGKKARVLAPAYFDKTPIVFTPDIAKGATRAEVVVRNSAGEAVQKNNLPLDGEPVTWAGTSASGTAFPRGVYQFEVTSYKGDEVLSKSQGAVYSKVTEVRKEQGQTLIVLEGGVKVKTQQITALKQ